MVKHCLLFPLLKCNVPCAKSGKVEEVERHDEQDGGDEDHHLGPDRVAGVVRLQLHRHVLPGADQRQGKLVSRGLGHMVF